MNITRSLADWLRESARSGLLFGRFDEPLDEYGKRIVRAILVEVESAQSADARLTPVAEGKARGSATESDLRDLRTAIAHLTEEREGLKAEVKWLRETRQKIRALLSPREGTQVQEDQELTDDLTRRDTQTLSEGQPAASTAKGDSQ